MRKLISASLVGSVSAFAAAACCILPLALALVGAGGSWLAVIGRLSAAGFPLLVASTALVVLSWLAALRLGAIGRWRPWLAASTALTGLAWLILRNEGAINDALIGWM